MKPKNSTFLLLVAVVSFSFSTQAQLPFTQHPGPNGLVINTARINAIDIDVNNNKWVSLGNFGLGMYDGLSWTVYNTGNSGIPSDSVICMDFDGAGNSWIGTKEGAVFKSGTNWTVYNTGNAGLPSNIITDVLSNGFTTWFGTRAGLVSYDGANWTLYNTINSGLTNDTITALVAGSNNDIWIGTRNGLFQFNSGNWNSYTTTNSPLSRCINDIEFDLYNRLWISCGTLGFQQTTSTDGIFFIQNGQVKNFKTDLYNNENPVTFPRAVNFSKDLSGKIYFRGGIFNNNGVIVVNGGSFKFYEYVGLNLGSMIFGSIFEVDNTNIIWVVSRYQFHMYSLDIAGFVQTLNAINLNNFRTLDINDVSAGINAGGDMHWDLYNPRYTVPKASGKNSVFTSAPWIGGIDQGGQIHLAAQTYRQTGIDYWPGPIDEVSVPFDSSLSLQFDRIWKIDKWKIEEFKNNLLAGNVANGTYAIPEELATWPAKGNGIVIGNLAPFVDFNADGVYNPIDGDYPLIKGDQMLYHIFNDSLAQHSNTSGLKLGIEIQASAYAYFCPGIADSNIVLNRTTLYNYTIINRSQNNYDSVYIGLWCDMDLGSAMDDYIGCDTTLTAGFTYNGDNNDETAQGYGLNPPIQNIKILRGTIADLNDGIDNDLDGTIDEAEERTTMNHFHTYNNINNTPTGNPNIAIDYYNYLHSYWLNGQHVTYGDDGTNPSNPPTNFIYSGTPYAATGWTEASVATPPADRRFLMSSGPVSLNAGDTANLDFAYVFTRDSINPNGLTTSIARNIADLQRIQYWFDTDNFPSCVNYNVGVQEINATQIYSVFPNPASTKLFIRNNEVEISEFNYTILNLLGAEVKSGKYISNSINIEELPAQIYILRIETNSGFEFVKFVKM